MHPHHERIRYLRLLKTILADATVQHRLPLDPASRIRAAPERRRDEMESDEPVNLLSGEEMGRLLVLLKERWPQWYAMVFVQFATARRFGEVSALRWEDIDEVRGVIKIRRAHWRGVVDTPKTGRVVHVPLTEELRKVLQDWRQELLRSQHRHIDSGWIFPSRVGKPHQNASCMQKAFVECLREMGLERRFSSHGLRRTANDLLRRVASGEVTRAITGHMTAAMTEHYSHVDTGEKKVAVERMLRLVQTGPAESPGK
ncbi:MAG TPA: tyrosine-type recombinase/integrase [Polyangia bacterium]|nr:tyrosine-type recombinase/integrase [Polyangia bacterium]